MTDKTFLLYIDPDNDDNHHFLDNDYDDHHYYNPYNDDDHYHNPDSDDHHGCGLAESSSS